MRSRLVPILLLWAIPIGTEAPILRESRPPVTAKTESRTAAKAASRPPRPARARFSQAYAHEAINRAISNDLAALAACLRLNPGFGAQRTMLELQWEPGGRLREVSIAPDPGEESRGCLAGAASRWVLPPHPGNQPFHHRAVLEM